MRLVRIIPSLLIDDSKLIKGKNFTNHRYLGDIYNAIKLFTEKKAHEIIILDKSEIKENLFYKTDFFKKISLECFIPITIGGGIESLDDASYIINSGVEKICLSADAILKKNLIYSISQKFGNQSIVISIDVKRLNDEYLIFTKNGKNLFKKNLKNLLSELENEGVGEIILTSIDREGTKKGYDIDLYNEFSSILKIPIIANGGAGKDSHFNELFSKTKISAASAGTKFVFYGNRDAVLINYPNINFLNNIQKMYEEY